MRDYINKDQKNKGIQNKLKDGKLIVKPILLDLI